MKLNPSGLTRAVRCTKCWVFFYPSEVRCYRCSSMNMLEWEWLWITSLGEIVKTTQRGLF